MSNKFVANKTVTYTVCLCVLIFSTTTVWSVARFESNQERYLNVCRSLCEVPCYKINAKISYFNRGQLKCDGTRAETRFRLSAKRTSPFKSARGASVQSTTGSRGVRISGSNTGYTMFRSSVKSTGYPLHSPVSPPFPLPCVYVCRHIASGFYCMQHTRVATLMVKNNEYW